VSIKSVEATILQVRLVVSEWDDAEFTYWLEEHTRYAVIDPIIQGLGWHTWDPTECHPEYWRYSADDQGRADYALFGKPDLVAIGNGAMPPDIIIESKSLRKKLDDGVEQLRRYVEGRPRMLPGGCGVLTNGEEWWLYEVNSSRKISAMRVTKINILVDDPKTAAESLDERLSRSRFPRK
jgi:hypothetical protein